MTLTGTISRRAPAACVCSFSFFLPSFFHLLVQYFTLSFIFYAPFVLFFSHPEICARPGLAFLVWLVGGGVYGRHRQAAQCMCVVLSSGLRRNSLYPCGSCERGTVGCIPRNKWSFHEPFDRATKLGARKVQEYHSILWLCYIVQYIMRLSFPTQYIETPYQLQVAADSG
jgi:hypothetical protein